MADPNSPEEAPIETYLIFDSYLGHEEAAALQAIAPVTMLPYAEHGALPEAARVLLYLGDEQIRQLAEQAMSNAWVVGVLPHPQAQHAMAAMGVKGSLAQVYQYYSECRPVQADALLCNDELVFSSVVIGQVLALRPADINQPQTNRTLVMGALKGLGKLKLKPYKLVTGKAREISTAALGMVVLDNTQSTLVDRAFSEDLSISDGHMVLLALAPRSITSYLIFLLRLVLPGKFSLTQLPPSLSLIQTDRLQISGPKGTQYLLDGKPVHAVEIDFETRRKALNLLPGPALKLQKEEQSPGKERVRLNHVPVGEGAGALLGKPLPLFSHATEQEYRDLFVALRDSAKVTSSLKVLMVLSVLLAMAGLYANSAPVIIGAMILAPLMSPVVALAMGLARTDMMLTRSSLRAISVGVGWGLATAVIVAWIMPLETPTVEMQARMSPNLLDLIVAIVSGVAGAYANSKEEIAKSLAGVAIAVALVPPLAVVGIGLGWGEWHMAGAAFLLLLTNLVGIALAAAATFLVLGFAPFKPARAGLGLSLLLVALIAIPLSLSFSHLVNKERIQGLVPIGTLDLSGLRVHIGRVEVTLDEPHQVLVVLRAERVLETSHVDELKAIIVERVGEPIMLEVQSNILR